MYNRTSGSDSGFIDSIEKTSDISRTPASLLDRIDRLEKTQITIRFNQGIRKAKKTKS